MSINLASPVNETDPCQPPRVPAVQRCCDARDRSIRQSRQKGKEPYFIRTLAAEAYCAAMPDLSGFENIRDFVACTSYGMVNGLIDATEGAKFLYAAQVATGVLRHEAKDQKRPAAAPPPTPLPNGNHMGSAAISAL
jgi:hypothetical protein